MQKRISILNAVAASGADCVTASGLTTITGLTPFHATDLQSFQIVRNIPTTTSKFTLSFTAGSGVVCAFALDQNVRGFQLSRVFTSTGTTTTSVMTELNGFFGGGASYGDAGFTTSTIFNVEYRYASNVLTVRGIATHPICNVVAATGNTSTIANGNILTLETQANVNATSIIFKVTGHGLVSGQLVSVGTLTGQTAANNLILRVVYVDANTFNLSVLSTNVTVKASGTGSAVGSVTVVPQLGFGSIADVNADALLNGSTATATQTTYQYNCAQIRGTYPVATNGSLQVADVYEATLWYPANLIAAPNTVFTNTADLETALAALVV
jgi:hypothetical protein